MFCPSAGVQGMEAPSPPPGGVTRPPEAFEAAPLCSASRGTWKQGDAGGERRETGGLVAPRDKAGLFAASGEVPRPTLGSQPARPAPRPESAQAPGRPGRAAATPVKGPDAASAPLCVGATRDAKGAAALAEEFGERRRGREGGKAVVTLVAGLRCTAAGRRGPAASPRGRPGPRGAAPRAIRRAEPPAVAPARPKGRASFVPPNGQIPGTVLLILGGEGGGSLLDQIVAFCILAVVLGRFFFFKEAG